MDKLNEIFRMQAHLDQEIIEKRHLGGISPEEWIQKDVLAILSELGELLDEVNFKWWKNPHALDDGKIREEMIDILHFFVSMCIHAGMDADMVYDIYMEKNKENIDRQHGRSKKQGYAVEET
ncbi:dUTPase [Christensenellaceae bacterium OttesenSCG-928-M15]|nr:dUTPase [Christensenellaceae bacterium OttesenSCG-928-M15]